MDVALIREVKAAIKNDPDWLEKFDTRQLKCLASMNQDVLAENVELIDKQDFKVSKRIIPRKYLNRYELYKKLKAAKRVKKNAHGEKILAKSKIKK
jgi:hypothetical protein